MGGKAMSKTAEQENFPVGKLIAPKLRPIVAAYYLAAREADDVADNPSLSTAEKLQQLENLEKSFLAQDETVAGKLGQIFRTENLDNSLFMDLLEAFRRDAQENKIEIWEQLLDYCRYSAAPVGRFMLAIHDESASTYLPAETLCAVLQIANHLQDLKTDACDLRRCYLPQKMMREFGVAETDLCLTSATAPLLALIRDICRRLRAMLKDAEVLRYLVQNRRLRAEIGVIFSLTNSMLKKIESGDVIARRPRLGRWDWLKALSAGIGQGIFIRKKSCNNKRKWTV